MPNLFSEEAKKQRDSVRPLADRFRPRTLAEVVGQTHILGENDLLRRMITSDTLRSAIFWGPPGTGKTTLAYVIAHETTCHFESFNAAMIGVADIRRIIEEARHRIEQNTERTILFLDEIHRFSRSQQDVLLEAVEQGVLVLIGATTENPAYTVNDALISRSTLFQLEPLTQEEIETVLRSAISETRGLGTLDVQCNDEAIHHWSHVADGDARRALNALEIAIGSCGNNVITLEDAQQSIQKKAVRYDRKGDGHYDHASAFIKSVRASDTNAALYWLATMLEAGEDPRFIARRMSIFASEDIGMADPRAMEQAASAWLIIERVGMPECQLTLSQLVIYLSKAKKSRTVDSAIWQARDDVKQQRSVIAPSDHDPEKLPTITATYYE
ncbi:MAG: replication-associated recombination protein A [Phycisphaerales bacterium]|jgi:putative ATPase